MIFILIPFLIAFPCQPECLKGFFEHVLELVGIQFNLLGRRLLGLLGLLGLDLAPRTWIVEV